MSIVEITVAAHDTTGGMVTKITEAAMIAKLGIDVYIVKVKFISFWSFFFENLQDNYSIMVLQAATEHSMTALSGILKHSVPDDWLGTMIRFVK